MAMMWASNPELTVDQAISVVKDSAYPVNTQVNDRGDKTGSAGAIDAAAAVKYAKTPDDVEKKPRPAAIGSIKLSKTSYEYDGKAKKPAVTVTATVDGQLVNVAEAITADTSDIDLTYQSGRVKVGTYTVKAKGIGKYKDTLQATFKINPRKTTIKSVKGNRKAITVKWSKKTTQVTGYQVKYSTSKSFSGSSTHTKTSTKNSTTSKKITKLKAKKKYYVQVRTYKTVNGKKYYSKWSTKKTVTTK